jgi:hypothetical protein
MLSIPLRDPKIWTLEYRTLNMFSILSLGRDTKFDSIGIELVGLALFQKLGQVSEGQFLCTYQVG